MVVFSFYIFDRHTECVYTKSWLPVAPPSPSHSNSGTAPVTTTNGSGGGGGRQGGPPRGRMTTTTSASDDAKLIFGTVFSLRNIVRKLAGDDDAFIAYRTKEYKLHYYETPANLRFVMMTDTHSPSMRSVMHQIYINLWVEYVVKNPLAPVEHKGGAGVKCELFELGLDQFIRGLI